MKLSRFFLGSLIAVCAVQFALAQLAQDSPAPVQHPFVPHGIDSLRQGASSKTEFTLDHSMLILASKLDPDNEDLRRVIAGVSAVSVHRYHFGAAEGWDRGTLSEVKQEYSAAGWKQLMNNHRKDGGVGVTNLWVRLDNNAVSDVAILFAKESEVDFVEVSGSISPIDLSHLGGHFGIPKIEGGVMVPNTQGRP
jgi:hypothetical protein